MATSRAESDRTLMGNGDFVRLLGSQVAGSIGAGVSKVATPLLALALTGSPAEAGLITASQTLPFLVIGLVAGVIVDRTDRRRIMIGCDVARFVALGSVPLAWWFNLLTIPQLFMVALVQGAAQSFANLAQVSALPRVVTRSQVTAAQSFIQASNGAATVIGPALGATIIGLGATITGGAAYAYGFDTLTYLLSTAALLTVANDLQATTRRVIADASASFLGRLWTDVAEGLAYLWADPDLRGMVVMNFVQRLLLGPLTLTAIVVAQRGLGANTQEIGWILTAGGIGSLIAAAFAPWARRHIPIWPMLIGIVMTNALGFALLATAPAIAVAMIGMAVTTCSESLVGIMQVAFRLASVPDALLGRVNGAHRWVAYAAMTIGAAGGGYAIDAIGPRASMGIEAIAMAALGIGIGAVWYRTAHLSSI